MTMTNEEILREFKQAKVPSRHVQVLAELNDCSTKEICDILVAQGVDHRKLPRTAPKNPPAKKNVAKPMPAPKADKPAPEQSKTVNHDPLPDKHLKGWQGVLEQRQFETGAVRDSAIGKGRYDLMPWGAIHALAKHCERGAIHYGERNVDKGIPQHSFIDSGVRHLSQYIQGDPEPHHLVAALWNIAWALEQELKRPDQIDLPERTAASGVAW